MAQVAGIINSKIVAFTRNRDTQSFVGRKVTPKKANGDPVYLIDGTGYILTPSEFKTFVKAGIIDSPKVSGAAKPAPVAKEQTRQASLPQFAVEAADSDFFKGPAPEFVMERPKYSGALDRFDDATSKISSFFDGLGFAFKEKAVAAMSSEEGAGAKGRI